MNQQKKNLESSSRKVKEKAEKSLIDHASAKAFIDLCRISGRPYKLTLSNYTTKVEGIYNIHYITSERSKRVFAGYKKIESDIKRWTANENPQTSMNELQFYNIVKGTKNIFLPTVYCLDLTAAYASVLKNDFFISDETYKYIKQLTKLDRLASVGMLASKKTIFQYDESNNLVNHEIKLSETAPYFYYSVKRTYEIIADMIGMLKGSYLFSWVDGIYFDDYSKIDKLVSYLNQSGYECKVDVLRNFDFCNGKSYTHISFLHNGKVKEFHIPKPDNFSQIFLATFYKQFL